MNPYRKTVFKIAVFLVTLCFVGAGLYQSGYRINFSDSVPLGVWHLAKVEPVTINSYVKVAATSEKWYTLGVERRYYRDGVHLLKKVAALEGDVVDYDMEEKLITVNGVFLPGTEICSQDGAKRVMPSVSFPVKVPPGKAWLTSEKNPQGYDSRYFGPVSLDLLCPARAIITW